MSGWPGAPATMADSVTVAADSPGLKTLTSVPQSRPPSPRPRTAPVRTMSSVASSARCARTTRASDVTLSLTTTFASARPARTRNSTLERSSAPGTREAIVVCQATGRGAETVRVSRTVPSWSMTRISTSVPSSTNVTATFVRKPVDGSPESLTQMAWATSPRARSRSDGMPDTPMP